MNGYIYTIEATDADGNNIRIGYSRAYKSQKSVMEYLNKGGYEVHHDGPFTMIYRATDNIGHIYVRVRMLKIED